MDEGRGQVLLVSKDETTVRWVQGCAAGTGADLLVAADLGTAAARWRLHPLVLVGHDLAAALARRRPSPRPHVHLLASAGGAAVGVPALGVEEAVALGITSVIGPGTGRHDLVLLLEAVADPRPPGRVVVMTAGSSGAGASTTAAALACVAARDRSVALVVADHWGPDPWLLLGGEPTAGLTWDDAARSRGAVAPVELREALPRHRGVAVLGRSASRGPGAETRPTTGADAPGPVPREVVAEVLRTARVAFDLVVVDLCPRDRDLFSHVVAAADRTWLVTRPQTVALATARTRAAATRTLAGESLRVLVRGRGVPDALVASALDVPTVDVRMRDDARLDEALDIGAGPVLGRRTPLTAAAREVLRDLVAR